MANYYYDSENNIRHHTKCWQAASEPGPFSLRLKRVFEPSLANTTRWYPDSNELSYRANHVHIIFIFQAQWPRLLVILSKYPSTTWSITVHPPRFGSGRKKERCGVVSTLFGILAKAVRGKTPQDHKVIGPLEFKIIKDLINPGGGYSPISDI